jgi:phospholipid/cholesterol/gamma-HCH transport system permease protein
VIQTIGRRTIQGLDHLLNVLAFSHRIAAILIRRPKTGRKLLFRFALEEFYFTAVQALPVLVFIALITGSTLIMQLAQRFASLEGRSILGDLMVLLVVRELGPLFTALIVILRSAVAVTAEISHMRVSGELDALELQGIDPLYLVGLPRILGVMVAVFCMFIVFDMVAILGGYCFSWIATDIPMENFLKGIGKTVSGMDIAVGTVKATLFGLTISIVSLYRGFSVRKTVTQIPMEISKAAIECLLYCLFVNVIISVVFYV